MKKAPLGDKRKKVIISAVLAISIFFIFYGIYSFQKIKPENGQKTEIKYETGDRPLKKNESIFINADGGLSLRKDRSQNAERLTIIPNKTKLEATEEIEGWYKVTYQGKEGWIVKQYTSKDTPAEDPYKGWLEFAGSGFKVKYPNGWKVKNYGESTDRKVTSLVAFSNQELPDTVPTGAEFLAPITFEISAKSTDEAKKNFSGISGATSENITVGGRSATKFIFVSAYSNTQMTAYVVSLGYGSLILSEAGGYQDDLSNMIKTISF